MEHSIPGAGEEIVYRMSIMAYIRPVITFIILLLLSYALSQSKHFSVSVIGYLCIILSLAFFFCRIAYIRTLKFYLNNDGVYLFSGIFPWTKGVVGTIWRDISDANYYTGFVSWATKSYRISVGHRFTKTNELSIPHVRNGNQAVIHINEKIKELARTGFN